MDDLLAPLLRYLADGQPAVEWQGWRLARIGGGHNNILFRATGHGLDLAVKWARRDERDRAGREFRALTALRGRGIAPEPLLLDRDTFSLSVTVQTWLDGEVRAEPPADDAAWLRLVEHLATVHESAPTDEGIAPAVLTFTSVGPLRERALNGLRLVPEAARSGELRELERRLAAATLPSWPEPALAFCRVDPNTLNFVRRPGPWASVDWENSGWGDPAFELADLLAHPAYLGVTPDRREWTIDAYCALRDDFAIAERARAYYALMLADWAGFFARKAYEVAHGDESNERLVRRPPEWYAALRPNAERYLEAALGRGCG
jgi:aminoglycoside phosphotransferase (APT) family kinase protein